MANSKELRREFIEYARNCILSRRPSNKEDFIIGQTAADSYVSFVEVDKLFSYNPEKWKDIKSIFDIDCSERIKEIYLELIGDNEFNKVDSQQASQYFRSNAIKHYYCFLKAREVVLGKTDSQHAVVDELPEFYQRNDNQSLQVIFYGAPGTGKSHAVKMETETWEKRGRVVRTTFHPDSDYSTFVGAYKPTTESVQRYDIYNKAMTRDGVPVMEQIITYEFVEQAFLKAYIDAWKNREAPEFLIIEEINRGNCAQIFGDLFQLLDRGDNGYSEYAIRADKDLQKHLCKAFEDVEIADHPNVKTGKELLLPSNLYIRATMNTSDQSLFPIDSAFKRRWDWKYEPIKYKNNGWIIEIGDNKYSWASFQKEVNKRIFEATNSEDKMLGDYFVKPCNGVISEKLLLNKVLFYLWNDVCKDYESDIFRAEDNRDIKFSDLYGENGTDTLTAMMKHMGVNLVLKYVDDEEVDDYDEDKTVDANNRVKVRYSINDEDTDEKGKPWGKGALVKRAVEIYCNNHPQDTAVQIRDAWMSVGFKVPHIVETEEDKKQRLSGSQDKTGRERAKRLELSNGESVYVSTEVGSDKVYNTFGNFLSIIRSKPEWGITIKEL